MQKTNENEESPRVLNRRTFLAEAGTAVFATSILPQEVVRGTRANSRIKAGLVGCGGRGSWIAALFQKHGGYEVAAVADYFQDRVDAVAAKLSIPESKRFTGLSGYKRLLDSGVEAVIIITPPYFHPEQAAAAASAGSHVYLAKPIAVDVPGCRSIAESAKSAADKKHCFLVDFQTRVNPFFVEAVRRVHDGAIGEIAFGESIYHAENPFERWYEPLKNDPSNTENWLRGWGLDRALSGDMIVEQDIHTLDVMNWLMKSPPLYALGSGGLTVRPKIGTCWDHFVVYYQYANKVGIQFSGRQFKGHGTAEGIKNSMFGSKGVLETEYGGSVLIRGESFYGGGRTTQIYEEGAVANIASFYDSVTRGDFRNPTVEPSVQSNLVAILGRKAAIENRIVTWDELGKDQERLIPNMSGLKA